MIPPPVEPAQQPIHIATKSNILENEGHISKSAVPNPVVLIQVLTAKKESRIASKKLEYEPIILRVIKIINVRLIITYVLNSSSLKASLYFLVSKKKYKLKLTPKRNIKTTHTHSTNLL